MRYFENSNTNPYANLALEEYLVMGAGDTNDWLLLWQNDPAVIVGRNQHTENQVERGYAQENGIAVVRRLSGGGAVYHDAGNLNFTIILRDAASLKNDFTYFTRPILDVLQSYGVDAQFSGRNDLTIEGKKFSGNAQYNHGSTVLHHGTILWDSDLSVLARVLKPKKRVVARGVDSHESRVTNLAPYMPSSLTLGQFKQDLIDHFFENGLCDRELLNHSGRLHPASTSRFAEGSHLFEAVEQKYRSDEWNWGEGLPEETGDSIRSYPASC